MYMCPVCGFNRLDLPPTNHNICPSCGTEFDLDDAGVSVGQLRQNWINNGSLWWSMYDERPANWSAIQQLKNLGEQTTSTYIVTLVSKTTYSIPPIFDFKGSFTTAHA